MDRLNLFVNPLTARHDSCAQSRGNHDGRDATTYLGSMLYAINLSKLLDTIMDANMFV